MKKALTVLLEDRDVIELMRVLMDSDAEGALEFLRKHFKGKARGLLEGVRIYRLCRRMAKR